MQTGGRDGRRDERTDCYRVIGSSVRVIRKVVKYCGVWLLLFLRFCWPVFVCVWYTRSVRSLGYHCHYNRRFLCICEKLEDAEMCRIRIIRKTSQWKKFLFRFHFFRDISKRMNRINFSYLRNKRCLLVMVCYEHMYEKFRFVQFRSLNFYVLISFSSQRRKTRLTFEEKIFVCTTTTKVSVSIRTNMAIINWHQDQKKVYIYDIFFLWSSNDIFKSSRMDDVQSATSNFITI